MFGKYCKADEKQADYVFSTAHKSKGLEWKTVILLDDFVEIPGVLTNERLQIGEDEKNLLYVAITRAKNNLVISKNIFNLLVTNGDFLERIHIPEPKEHENTIEEPKCSTSEKCNACNESMGTTERKSFRICQIKVNVHNYNKSSGTLCSTCSMQNIQTIPVWMSDFQHESTLQIPNSYRSSLRFICGPISKENIKRAKDLFMNNASNEPVWWEAQVE